MTARKRRPGSKVPVCMQLPPEVATSLAQLARSQRNSLSATAAALVAEGLRASVEHAHASLIEATCERAIREQMVRLQETTTRAAVDAQIACQLVPQVLMRQGMGRDQVRGIVRTARKDAWQSLGEPALPEVDEGVA